MGLLKKMLNKKYTISAIIILIFSRYSTIVGNKQFESYNIYLLLLSICFVSFALRHNKLRQETRNKKKWIEIF